MAEPRTFKVDDPPMEGSDVGNWQVDIEKEFARMGIDCPIKADGVYGAATRSYTASLCHALGMHATHVMKDGVTPQLRIRIRNRRLTDEEQNEGLKRKDYRATLRKRYASAHIVRVHRPVTKIIDDGWGYHLNVHDGVDVICQPDARIFAMVKCKIIDVRASGWWGKAPSGNISLGDGIVQMQVLENIGPFKKGYHIGYGHAEKANVKVGQIVEAGDQVAHAGLARAWHIHLMYNDGSTSKGVGKIDPRKILDYAVDHG